jgi:hypothetical protein
LDFPGHRLSGMASEAVDADLVARALAWAAESPAACGGTYNLTNGDVFLWKHVWPVLADTMAMDTGTHTPADLVRELPRRGAQWASLVDRFDLRAPRDILDFVGYNSLVYVDGLLSAKEPLGGPLLNSTIAVRQAGFHDCLDTSDMFRKWFGRLQADRLLPAASAG